MCTQHNSFLWNNTVLHSRCLSAFTKAGVHFKSVLGVRWYCCGHGVLFGLIGGWWIVSVCVPNGFSLLSLQQWVSWRLTGWQQGEEPFLESIENHKCLQELYDLNRVHSERLGRRKAEIKTERGNAVSQRWEHITLKVTTPSIRWFSTEGNGAQGLSHKKQFIAKPPEVWEIQNLTECQIFSETDYAMSGW